MNAAIKGLWNIVLSGYPRSGKTILARKLVEENQYFARIGVDELRDMLFDEAPPCRDEFLMYSIIVEMRDTLLEKGYSVIIDSTAPDNIIREFLLRTKVEPVNPLLVLLNVDREVLIKRNIEKFGNAHPVFAYDERWEEPKGGIPVFKFKSNTMKESDDCYVRLMELLESEVHPFKPEFHLPIQPLKEIRKALKNFLQKPQH